MSTIPSQSNFQFQFQKFFCKGGFSWERQLYSPPQKALNFHRTYEKLYCKGVILFVQRLARSFNSHRQTLFILRNGRGLEVSIFQSAASLNYLENMKIQCNIQVIIYPFLLIVLLSENSIFKSFYFIFWVNIKFIR